MAILKYITAKKSIDGTLKNVYYIGTYQADGWIYFNDDSFWRYHSKANILERLYLNKEIWVESNGIKITNVSDLSSSALDNIIHGGGSLPPGGQGVEDAVNWILAIADDDSHGYDQSSRWGADYDCSSLIYEGFRVGGGFNLPVHSGYTGTMVSDFTNAGFTWYPGLGNDVSECMRGDILLNIVDHVELYIGNQQNVGAHINEFGDITGGEVGDQSGTEISITGYYSYPWDGILRYEG